MSNSKYVNVVLSRENWENLKLLGDVPESFNDVVGRLLKEKEPLIQKIRLAKATK